MAIRYTGLANKRVAAVEQGTYKTHLLPAYNPELHPDAYQNQDTTMNIGGKSGSGNKRELTIVPG